MNIRMCNSIQCFNCNLLIMQAQTRKRAPKNRTNTPVDDVEATYPGYIFPAFTLSALQGRDELVTASMIDIFRLMTTLLNELERTGGRYGLQTMCEGGGQANVTIIESLA